MVSAFLIALTSCLVIGLYPVFSTSPQYTPMPVEDQVAIIFCGTNGLLQKVPVDKVANFEAEFLFFIKQNHANILENLRKGKLEQDDLKTLREVATDMAAKYDVK